MLENGQERQALRDRYHQEAEEKARQKKEEQNKYRDILDVQVKEAV